MARRYFSVIWIAVLLLPNLFWLVVAEEFSDALIRGVPPSLVFLLALVAWTRRPRLVLVAMLPLYILLPFEVYYLIVYGQPSSDHVVAVIAESNFSETLQYVGLGVLLLCGSASILFTSMTIYFAWNAISLPPHKWLTRIAAISLLPILQYAWAEWDWASKKQTDVEISISSMVENINPITDVPTPMGATLSDSYPLGVFFRLRDFWGERERINTAADRIRVFDFKVLNGSQSKKTETYVLVLGESSRPDHWHINGYERKTTPRLTEMTRLASFRNVVSPWPATRLAVPVILVGQQAADHRSFPGRASIVSLFKQAGFRTYWLSNQAPLGVHDSIISVHAQEADETVFTNMTDFTKRGTNDSALLPVFRHLMLQPYLKKFFVIHTMGSHKRYDKRYPQSFDLFQPSLSDNVLTVSFETVVNSYDNSILFTDYILAEFIDELDRSGGDRSALVYVSDHGETLPLNGCREDGHGRINDADFRVAALLWVSNDLNLNNPELLKQAQIFQDAPLESLGAFHTLTEIANLSYPDWNPERSWVSPSWQPRPRWTNAVPDFDKAERLSPCKKLKMP